MLAELVQRGVVAGGRRLRALAANREAIGD
jgi:hypothetical protein